ncbi:MAG: hypothetical protein GPOALKHO_000875 [Sodalis sp.]|uniref:hypothetical protein n=1 Tax=Sodalis sp. (in: enterobacteria) TaxID=1898979 RepID=UPI003872E36E|nr:MAG: hypothetical protein GPOALKHO_000875 [Sodalis sp.]
MKLHYQLQAARQPEKGLPVVPIHGLFVNLDNLDIPVRRQLGENHRALQMTCATTAFLHAQP